MLAVPAVARAQALNETADDRAARIARAEIGVAAGTWSVETPVTATPTDYKSSIAWQALIQRGLDKHLALENTVGLWKRVSTKATAVGGGDVVTKSYLVPITTALKFYPVTTPKRRLEPFVTVGIGLGFGVQDVSTNAVGGGGSSVVTGFSARAGIGVEAHLIYGLGAHVVARYQWLKFGDRISDQEAFAGNGIEAGLTYRLRP